MSPLKISQLSLPKLGAPALMPTLMTSQHAALDIGFSTYIGGFEKQP